MDNLRADTPTRLQHLLKRCLDRDVRQRLRDIGEARVEIATIQSAAPDATIEPRAMPSAKTIRLMVRLVVVSTMVVTTLVAWSLGDWS